jgi:nitrite reductase/ring-hydroxylating ferredoxin subunit
MPWYHALTLKPGHDEDFILLAKIEGREACIVKTRGKTYAFQNRCPHAGGSLCNGWLEEGHIVCPNHHFKFEMETGKGHGNQGNFIQTYETKWNGRELQVKMRPSLNPFRWFANLFK